MITRPHAIPSRTLPARAGALLCAVALSLSLGLSLSACAPRVDSRGNQLHPEDVTPIQIGQSTRAQVRDRLGSPSSSSSFKPETWYYISEITETTAFLAPEIKERTVYAIEFDEAGVVSSVRKLDETAAEEVEPAEGATPTAGNQLSIFEQLLSNLGRFSKDK